MNQQKHLPTTDIPIFNMAPITATSTGIQPQVIDDVELSDLIVRLNAFDTSGSSAEVDVSGLVRELEHYSTWKFQELVSLELVVYGV